MQVPFPPDVVAIIGLSFTFNTLLAEEYISSFKNEANIQYTKNMGKDLLAVFRRRLERHKWFDANTKRQALLKIDKINLIIGRPDKLRYDPLLDYSYDDVWSNISKITQWKIQKYLNLEGKEVIDIPFIDWKNLKLIGKQPYIVNAFYTPTENSIYIPLAYLQKPFIDLEERGIEYNLARIGYTLAHEMSHALDESGSKYDYKGNLTNWASPKDLAKITSIKDDITKQYEVFAKRDGIIFDASIAIGENMADIAGLAICEEYLKDFQDKNNDIIPIKDLSFQAFFVYIAVTNRQHIYKAAIKSQLKVNPHPLDKYRVNVPLSRLELFRSIYNVQKGDDMYWPSTSTIW
jgi:putative endopeptidase